MHGRNMGDYKKRVGDTSEGRLYIMQRGDKHPLLKVLYLARAGQ